MNKTETRGRKKKDEINKPMQRVHWTGPLLWPQIELAARQVGYPWSPTEIVQRLRKANPVFEHLSPRRISEWRNSDIGDRLVWEDRVLKSVKKKHKAGGTVTRVGILVSLQWLSIIVIQNKDLP